MPNIQSFYEGTETVDLDNECFATVRKYLSEEDFSRAQDALLAHKKYSETKESGTSISAVVDPSSYSRSLVLSALVSWNLTDNNNNPVPINAKTVGALPNVVFRKLLDKVNELNKEDAQEATPAAEGTFRTEDSDGDTVSEGS